MNDIGDVILDFWAYFEGKETVEKNGLLVNANDVLAEKNSNVNFDDHFNVDFRKGVDRSRVAIKVVLLGKVVNWRVVLLRINFEKTSGENTNVYIANFEVDLKKVNVEVENFVISNENWVAVN